MKVAILWLINEKGEILLGQRAAHDSSDAGMWGVSVSGGIEDGETAEQTLLREVKEELGIAPSLIGPVRHLHDPVHSHSDGRKREFSILYASIASDVAENMRLDPNEVAATKWASLGELKRMYVETPEVVHISSDKPLWEEIFVYLEKACKEVVNAKVA